MKSLRVHMVMSGRCTTLNDPKHMLSIHDPPTPTSLHMGVPFHRWTVKCQRVDFDMTTVQGAGGCVEESERENKTGILYVKSILGGEIPNVDN